MRLFKYISIIICALAIFSSFKATYKEKMPEKPELIYVFDPLCGWCYGFSPVMMQVKDKYGNSLKISVISGGMITGDKVRPLSELAPFIKDSYVQVEDMTDVEFGETFLSKTLEEGKISFSSSPPSLALTVLKSFEDTKAVEYAHAIQRMIYYDGKDPNSVSSYTDIVKQFNIDQIEFERRFNDSAYKTKTIEDYKYAYELDADVYPMVLLKYEGKTHVLTKGYTSFAKIEKQIRNYIK